MTATLNDCGHFTNGVLANAAMAAVMQPTFTVKTYTMNGLGRPPLGKLYNGFLVNALTGGPAEGCTFLTHHMALKIIKKPNETISDLENFFVSGGSGAIGALALAPCERMMIQKQIQEGSLISLSRDIIGREGLRKAIFKGFVPTALRDAAFNCGIFAMNDIARKHLQPLIENKTQRDSVASITVGAAVGWVSTPLDGIKTLMQADSRGVYNSFYQTTHKVVTECGLRSLFRGATSRCVLISGAIFCIAESKERIPEYLPSYFHK